jgi:protease I
VFPFERRDIVKVAVLIEDHYQVLEVWYPYLRLREDDIETEFVGSGRKKRYESTEGYPAAEERSAVDASAGDYAGVVIPGGYAPDMMRRSKEMISFVREMHAGNRLVAAICHAGWVLASADVLRGKKATCFFAIKDDVVNAGAEYLDKDVVIDGNLITSRNPYDLPRFCAEIVRYLKR